MTVRVYSGEVMVEEIVCTSEEQVQKVVDYWHDEGFKVRVFE
jgi:uncharacterized protein YqiB (DUF1249 family)